MRSYGEVADVVESLPATIETATRLFGISQRELARRAGISSATISRMMTGKDLTTSSTVALLRALDDLARGQG
jgi:transcriptional regulator with XRE-family HTH domain